MDDVNNILPGVAGAAGTGAVMIAIAKTVFNNWLAKADRTEELVRKVDRSLAVIETKVSAIEKDLDGIGNAMRRDISAIQKEIAAPQK